jgi:FdhD protein
VVDRPRLGISACLLGEAVRYDGAHKRDAWLVEVLGPRVEWVPVCPEVEAGLGTPREPIELDRGGDGNIRVMTVRSRRDLTETMRGYAARRVGELAEADLDGYVFKADSPTCDAEAGVFARELRSRLPRLPVIDEKRLADPNARGAFVTRVFAHHNARSDRAPERSVDVVRLRGSRWLMETDRAATEEPLEIRLNGEPFAVIMRTPGADRELAAGFLLSERIVRSADDLGTIEHCTAVDPEADSGTPQQGRAAANIINVTLAGEAAASLDLVLRERRNVTMTSSCGLCGRRTIESLAVDVPPLRSTMTIAAATLVTLPQKLRVAQSVFDDTGGIHAAGLFTSNGALVDIAEDVGRHNAVDKVVGRMLMLERLPLADHILCVSGRTSFEILQKALFAGIPVVAAVSAPSTLAIDLAQAFNITLAGFVRGDSCNIYAHASRIV